MVVDAVVRHWVNGLVDKAEAKGKTGREGRHQSAVFYADDGMVVSSDPAWLQGAFNALVAISDRVGLLTNVGKTVSMVYHPCLVGTGNRRGPPFVGKDILYVLPPPPVRLGGP